MWLMNTWSPIVNIEEEKLFDIKKIKYKRVNNNKT